MNEDKNKEIIQNTENPDPNQGETPQEDAEWSAENEPQVKICLSRKQKILIAIVLVILLAELAVIAYYYLKQS